MKRWLLLCAVFTAFLVLFLAHSRTPVRGNGMPYRLYLPLVVSTRTEYVPSDWCVVSRSVNVPGGNYYFPRCWSTVDWSQNPPSIPDTLMVAAARFPSPYGGTAFGANRTYYHFDAVPSGPVTMTLWVEHVYLENVFRCQVSVHEFTLPWQTPISLEAWESGVGDLLGSVGISADVTHPFTITIPLDRMSSNVVIKSACEEEPGVCTTNPEEFQFSFTTFSAITSTVRIEVPEGGIW